MTLALAPGISFCETGGQLIFLDLYRDRYFSLGPAASSAFAALVERAALSGEQFNRLDALKRAGILVEDPLGQPPRPCRSIMPDCSPLDRARSARPGLFSAVAAASSIQRAKLALRRSSLASVCARISSGKELICVEAVRQEQLERIALAFAAAGKLVPTLDQCLPLSVAIARRCIAAAIDANLCIGVKIRPFEAHAWVTAGDMLISDRVETVRSFTPVLVL